MFLNLKWKKIVLKSSCKAFLWSVRWFVIRHLIICMFWVSRSPPDFNKINNNNEKFGLCALFYPSLLIKVKMITVVENYPLYWKRIAKTVANESDASPERYLPYSTVVCCSNLTSMDDLRKHYFLWFILLTFKLPQESLLSNHFRIILLQQVIDQERITLDWASPGQCRKYWWAC